MCGLFGVMAVSDSRDGTLDGPVRELTAQMARRGPDDAGFWTDHRRCALGFRRLSILDLTPAGHQPMVTTDGRHALVFNGEIYNFQAIRQELEQSGEHPHSSGDAEVVLLALARWKHDALAKLNGMFALAFYDTHERRLLLARDHAGIKPLHVATTKYGVVFSSQYEQIVRHPWCRDVGQSVDGLGLYLRFGFVPSPYALHDQVSQVGPGEWMQVDDSGRTTRGRFFSLPRATGVLRGAAAVEQFEEVFARAVSRHLIADVPVGVLLSGGVDSPLVAAEVSRQVGAGVPAFTIAVDDAELDESEDAASFARELGLRHVVQRISWPDVLGLLDDVVAASEPTADYSMFPMLAVSRLAREHVKVVLSGDGGDELFWGYPSRFTSTIELARYFGLPRFARYAAIAARRAGLGGATRDVIRFDSVGRLYQRKHTLLPEHDLAAIFPTLPALPDDLDTFTCTSTDRDEVAYWVRDNEFRFHLARVLAKVDRASMYNSLEVRVPMLDKEVIDLAWRIEWQSCLDVDTRIGKRVLRAVLASRVRHRTDKKKGFTVPMYEWLIGPLWPLVRDQVLSKRELFGATVSTAALTDFATRLRAGDRSLAWGMWLLLALALWERKLAPVR